MTIVKISENILVNMLNVQCVCLDRQEVQFIFSSRKDVMVTKFCDTELIAYEAFEFLNERLKAGDTFRDITD